MKYLRDLAEATGRSFAYPQTQQEASEQIKELKKFRRTNGPDRRRETQQIRSDMAGRRGSAAAVRDDELSGYGSTASWAAGHE